MWKYKVVGPDLANNDRPPLDRGRVRRALDLHVEQAAPAQYHVRGPEGEDEYVEIYPHFHCHCGDAIFREVICKHIIAALLAYGDEEAVDLARAVQREEG